MKGRSQIDGLLRSAETILPDIVAVRRRLHCNPEIGLDLPESQAIVLEELRRLGLDPKVGLGTTSVVASIDGPVPGQTVLLRADMDALPLNEETGLDFSSLVAGAMHACGHDTHVAMLLGAARLLIERQASLSGQILLMFQPEEEGLHGARMMLDEGLLDSVGTPVTGAFALHISTMDPTRTINVRSGLMLAAADTLRITIQGRGGHASTPHAAVDPVAVTAQLVFSLPAIVTRRINVFDPAVITIPHVKAGTTHNMISESAHLEGTIRTFSEATRTLVHAEIRRVAEGIADDHGATADIQIERGYPVTANDEAFAELVRSTAFDMLGPGAVFTLDSPLMAAEDFSYVLQRVRGAIAFLGARFPGQDPDAAPTNHSNRVVFDESAMPVGTAIYAAVALRFLEGPFA